MTETEDIMIKELLEYQKVDGSLREIEVSLSTSEERKKAVAAQSVLKSANENIARLDAKAEELASKYNALMQIYEKVKDSESDYENIVETCEDLGELNYLKKRSQLLSDEINNLAESVDTISKEIKGVLDEFAKLRQDTKKANAVYKEFAPKYSELKSSKEEEMNKIKASLKKIEKKIPEEEMTAYLRRRKEKIFPVLYPANTVGKSAHCGRCGNELPIAYTENLKRGELVECESCHRLLYSEAAIDNK